MASLLLAAVKMMTPGQLEDFKFFGSLGVAEEILKLIDQNNQKERARFLEAILLMHFSDAEIQRLRSGLTEVEPTSGENCVVM